VAADKGYDTRDFVEGCRHIDTSASRRMNTGRNDGSAIYGRTSRHPGYAVSRLIGAKVDPRTGKAPRTTANRVLTVPVRPRTARCPEQVCGGLLLPAEPFFSNLLEGYIVISRAGHCTRWR